MRHYSFKPGWASVIGTLVLLPVFVSLGLWQLRRAEEKEALVILQHQQAEAAPLILGADPLPIETLRYRKVLARGRYDTVQQLLLDNQVREGRIGYYVLTPLKLEGSDWRVLVNRGWVPALPERSRLPDIALLEGTAEVRGTVDKFPSVGLRLTGAEVPTAGWPAVVQVLDAEALSGRLGYPLLPYQVLLAPAQPDGYARNWKPAQVDSGTNRGYALQWFSFAAVLAFLFLWYGWKPRNPRQLKHTR